MSDSLVLSALEFDVLWESLDLPPKHVALDVPSPGMTHTERRELVAKAWRSLGERGLADGTRPDGDLLDRLMLLAHPELSIDSWVWTDRQISALTVASGEGVAMGVVDGDEVWLIPVRDTALAEAAVSIAGELGPGPGRSVSLPSEVVQDADELAKGDPHRFVAALEEARVELSEAQVLAGMLSGAVLRGQVGVERRRRDHRMVRADRVVAFHDTAAGRYLYLRKPSTDGRLWSTVTPADNRRLSASVQELVDEV
ncbi:ESX secretion-associated protein EspG [Labedaea rhizosphaerae]|uniref:ESAT-6 protein secretion system EspG family protein n=1 Tax=Labedaea rhizosphaerae TaxID=598644 RepID=A0A4R6SQ38_LABRH|nr:ESX secretion-associated protein EspG [Labedaea rhizosphaerae]TDQ05373.1 ESAT-6 protein secretion system EspG family protein [Labedaea rhizosphaerae]